MIFAVQPNLDEALNLKPATVQPLAWSRQQVIWALEVYPVFCFDGSTRISFNFSIDLFRRDTISRLVEMYEQSVASLLHEPPH